MKQMELLAVIEDLERLIPLINRGKINYTSASHD